MDVYPTTHPIFDLIKDPRERIWALEVLTSPREMLSPFAREERCRLLRKYLPRLATSPGVDSQRLIFWC